jgi:plasmid stabilization system protein ParE
MSFIRSVLAAAAILGVVTSHAALAQTTTPSSTLSSKIDDVTHWTTEQWNRANAKWEEETEKWADCQKQAKDQDLTGRKSWSFLASCMTPSSASSKIDDVTHWTTEQWDRAKAKWEKKTRKWADCQKQAKDQDLTGRKSWSFLASCMTPSSVSSRIDDVTHWTTEQWNRAQAKWEKETERWADCQKQAKDQDLSGRKSWSFLASCMSS